MSPTTSRRALPNRAVIVRPGRVRVEILEPIAAADPSCATDELRVAARRAILARLDEPDLAPQQTRAP